MAAPRTNNSWQENTDAESSSSPVPIPVVLHEGFTKEQTLFFIDLMRRHIKSEGKGRPKTLEDLNARLTSTRGSKKRLWNVTAEKLSSNFMLSFCPDKVARKWNTLVEAYRKVKDRNAGKETTRFEFYSEIDDLLGGQDDSDSDDVGTSEELDSESWRNLASPVLKIKMASPSLNNNCQENSDAASSPSPGTVTVQEGFTKDQTLFFIDLMRQHIKSEGKGRPKTLEDLNARLTSARGSKKRLWNVTAEKLSSNFMLSFCPDKVARKWNTLVEAYRKVKDRNAGKETTRFQFYSEIDDLLGGQDDSDFDDVGTSEELDSESWRNLASPDLKVKMASPSLNNNCQENSDAASSPSPGTVTVQEGFTKEQSLFLINLMRQHIEDKGEGLPKTLEDLNARLKSARGSKKLLWTDMAEKMASHFTQSFCPDKVARKWCTLVDAYKRVKDNKSSGKLTIRFQFYSEMDDLLGGEDDVVFPDVGTSEEGNSESLRNLLNPKPKIKMTVMRANIYLDENMKMFIDPQRCIPFLGPLYHIAADLTKYYLNEDHTIMVNMVKAGDINTITDTCLEHTDAACSPSPVPVSAHEGFTKDQTLFLIDLMRQHIEAEGEGLPKTLKDLNARLKSAMGSKKQLWTDTAEKMASHFTQSFCPDKVARKWCTLVEAYKIVKDRNRAKAVILGGKVNTRFQFYSEMDDLLRGEEDVDFPVVGTSEGLEVLRPEALRHCSKVTTSTDTASSPATTPTATLTEPPRKYRRVNDEMMQFLRESEEASRRRHEETLAQLKSAQQGFEALMTKLLDKL